MNSIGFCSKGLIFVLWSELVLEGIHCIYEFVNSLITTSKYGPKSLNPTTVHNKNLLKTSTDQKKTPIQRFDSYFTRVLFFPDQDSIAGLLYKDYGDIRQVASPMDLENNCVSHPSSVTQNSGLVHHLDNSRTSTALNRTEGGWTDSTINSLPETHEGYMSKSPLILKRRGALQEMVFCLDGAVSNIDVCVLLLTCDRLTSSLLRAKARGVRVRVLLDRSMAAVEGSALPLLRKCCIPVRLLPQNNGGGNNNNAASQRTHRTNNGNAAVDGDAMLHNKIKISQNFGTGFGCNKSAGTTAASSSGLMHHKFAVIDSWRKTVGKTINLGQVRKENNVLVTNKKGIRGGAHQYEELERKGGITGGNGENWAGSYPEGTATVITGSFNWTWSAVTNNNENVIISNRPELVVSFSEQFELLWLEAW